MAPLVESDGSFVNRVLCSNKPCVCSACALNYHPLFEFDHPLPVVEEACREVAELGVLAVDGSEVYMCIRAVFTLKGIVSRGLDEGQEVCDGLVAPAAVGPHVKVEPAAHGTCLGRCVQCNAGAEVLPGLCVLAEPDVAERPELVEPPPVGSEGRPLFAAEKKLRKTVHSRQQIAFFIPKVPVKHCSEEQTSEWRVCRQLNFFL